MYQYFRKPLLVYVGWFLLSVLFLISVIGKLYPTPANGIDIFETDFLIPNLPSWVSPDFISLFSRCLLAVESFFVISFLWPNRSKKLIGYGAIGLLSIFSIHLIFQIINNHKGNCGCFGQLIEMTPTEALIKNFFTIGLILLLIRQSEKQSLNFTFFQYASIFLFSLSVISLITPQKISIVTNSAKEYTSSNVLLDTASNGEIHIGLDLDLNNKLEENEFSSRYLLMLPKTGKDSGTVQPNATILENNGPAFVKSPFSELVQGADIGRKIICWYNAECAHCMESHKLLKSISNTKNFPKVHIIFRDGSDQEKIDEFFKNTGYKTSFSIITPDQKKDFRFKRKILPASPPAIYYLYNGNQWFTHKNDDGEKDLNVNALKAAIQREK
jgi:hypothetical protein